MEDLVFRLSKNEAGQLLDGLAVLIEQWQATSDYLTTGESNPDTCIREASDADEADAIAQMYQGVYEKICGQMYKKCDKANTKCHATNSKQASPTLID